MAKFTIPLHTKGPFNFVVKTIETYDKRLERSIYAHHECNKLLRLEGAGPINVVNLYIWLGCVRLGAFNKGEYASTCMGLASIQNSLSSKIKLGTIGKKCADVAPLTKQR